MTTALWAGAATISVTNTNDSGAGSLRQAITDAADGDVINITAAGTITLASELPYITKAITVNGATAGTTLSGNNTYRVLTVQLATGTVTLNGLNVINGKSTIGAAAGLFAITGNNALVALNRCTFSGCNTTGSEAYGGAIATSADMNLTNCTLYGNTAQLSGGALATLSACTVNVLNCTVYNNTSTAAAGSGGFDVYASTAFKVQNTILAGNKAGATPVYTDLLVSGGGTLTSLGNNLSNTAPFAHASDLTNKNLTTAIKLSALAQDASGAWVCALQNGSAAIGAAATAAAPVTDQCGHARIGTADIGAYEFIPTLAVTPAAVTICGANACEGSVTITSNTAWTVADDAAWLSVGSTSGSGNATLTFSASSANNTAFSRVATITVHVADLADKTVTVTQEAGLATATEKTTNNTFAIYPNPCTDGFTVTADEAPATLTVMDLTGRTVLTCPVNGTTYVPVGNLQSGIYLVRVNNRVERLRVK